jgi:dihydroorotate dehydrogenase electron transfer subunit
LSKIYTTTVIENRQIIKDHFLITLENPLEETIEPGRFFMISPGRAFDPLLRRPLSIHRISNNHIQFLYKMVGRGTVLLSEMKNGDSISIMGPLGRPFPIRRVKNVILIAGGIGIAPIIPLMDRFLSLNRWRGKVMLFYGVRGKRDLLLMDEITQTGIDLVISTDDGSFGKRGDIVSVLSRYLHNFSFQDSIFYACGPRPMLKSLAKLMKRYKFNCYVSMEENMACGIGICMGCSIMTVKGYKRVCREGPVFSYEEIQWDLI